MNIYIKMILVGIIFIIMGTIFFFPERSRNREVPFASCYSSNSKDYCDNKIFEEFYVE